MSQTRSIVAAVTLAVTVWQLLMFMRMVRPVAMKTTVHLPIRL
jgi:hypothetical protein